MKSEKTIRITKKVQGALDAQLSFDDVLYFKFRALHEVLSRREERFRKKKQVAQIRTMPNKDGVMRLLEIAKVEKFDDGMIIYVRGWQE